MRANGTYLYSYDLLGGAVDFGMNDPFGELLPSPINIAQVGVFGQYFQNIRRRNGKVTYMIKRINFQFHGNFLVLNFRILLSSHWP